jgi:predicted GNAT family N-acyltransferase
MEAQIVKDLDALQECLKIRNDVFIKEQNVPEELERDEFDVIDPDKSIHVLIYDDDRSVATGRLKYISKDTVQFNRIAVKKAFRGKGFGEKVLAMLEKITKEHGYKKIYLESQLHAKDFYEKFGYKNISPEPFLEAGILHVAMEKRLK